MSPAAASPWAGEQRAARAAVLEAWGQIEDYYGGDFAIHHKDDGPATDADHAADAALAAFLARHYPDDAILSEETPDTPERLGRERLWIVDPIDGTNDFIRGTGNFALQLALATPDPDTGGHRPRAAALYQPATRKLYHAAQGGGAWLEQDGAAPRRLRVSKRDAMTELVAVVTRTHRTSRFLELIERLGPAEVLSMGSIGVKMMQVAEGRADFYLNNARGFCKEWDVCAPELIVREAGGRVSDLRGEPLRYNQPCVTNEDGLLVSNGPSHEALRRRILELEIEIRREHEER